MITVVLLDLDGVIRHFDPAHVADVEHRHGLRPGLLMEAAFTPSLLLPAITGGTPRHQWVLQVGDLVDNHAAVQEWMSHRGAVDWDLVALVDELRAGGLTVAVLTNGTDSIDDELSSLGLDGRFDAVFSTYDIGYAKPDSRAFHHVCAALGVEPTSVFFTDDSPSKLPGAIEIGMTARPFRSLDQLKQDLVDVGAYSTS